MAHRFGAAAGLVSALVAVLLNAGMAAAAASPRGATSAPLRSPRTLAFAPAEVVVIANAEALDAAPGGVPLARSPALARVIADFGLARARELGPTGRGHSARRERAWLLTSARAGFDPVAAAAAIRATGAVLAACANYRFHPFFVPDDLYVPYQWYVDDNGYADVRLPQAWDVERGDTTVVIAIMDTGVDTTHPDLASQIWRNPGEITGNAVDDDGNGLVDDVQGWDFGVGDNDPKPEYTTDASGIDVGFHGTFCAGIASAATHNGEGIAGVGWECRIMPLKISHPDSGFASSAIAGAFLYAADQGASVLSMSFGGPAEPGVPEFFQALVDIVTHEGVLCVAAAGNDGVDVPMYPAACGGVLAVGATDFDNARASFSNWGSWVDVAAPGSTMWSTICQNYTFTDLDQLFYILLFAWDGVNPYMYGDGTSFACPLVAGICGLVRAKYPGLTPGLVARHVIANGDAATFDHPMGVKANAFLSVSGTPTAVTIAESGAAPVVPGVRAAPNPVAGAGELRFDLPAAGWARIAIFDAQGRLVRTLVDGVLTAGVHRARWDGADGRGARLPAAVYFVRLETPETSATSKVVFVP